MNGENTNPGQDQMLNCPKCGFEQPVDRYCAKCGVDMTRVPKKTASSLKNPALIGSVVTLAIAATALAVRFARSPQPTAALDAPTKEARVASNELASSGRGNSAPSSNDSHLLEGRASPEMAAAIQLADQSAPSPVGEATNTDNANGDGAPALASAVGLEGENPNPASGKKAVGVGAEAKDAASAAQATPAAPMVTYAWAEISKEYLAALLEGNMTEGFHLVTGLDARLRQKTGYRLVEVTRKPFVAGGEPVDVANGDRGVHFGPLRLSDAQLTGGFGYRFKSPQGEVLSTTIQTATINKDSGVIVTFPSDPANPGQTEIVLFILPRWGADR